VKPRDEGMEYALYIWSQSNKYYTDLLYRRRYPDIIKQVK